MVVFGRDEVRRRYDVRSTSAMVATMKGPKTDVRSTSRASWG